MCYPAIFVPKVEHVELSKDVDHASCFDLLCLSFLDKLLEVNDDGFFLD